jgi:hypothetical protein
MRKRVWQLLCVTLVLILLEQVVYADVAPPGPFDVGPGSIACVTMIVLGFFVVVIVFVSFLVIRAIKKKNTSTDDE